jgi:pimeloyl-ACP methyl ester carboxylesterase
MRRQLMGLGTVAIVALGGAAPPVHAADAAALQWTACSGDGMVGLDCAFLTVPRNWSNPSVGTMQLAMVRHRADGPADQRIGSLFFNPGGPGGPGLLTASIAWSYLPAEARARFDLVSWDPRGIGASEGLVGCPSAVLPPPPAVGPVNWTQIQNRTRTAVRAANAACAANNPDVVPYMSTNAAVRDLDAMREAVGDERLSYWGWSYGTRIGYTYALRYPDRVRALILDGSVSPNSSMMDFASTYGSAADPALNLLFQKYPSTAGDYRAARAMLAKKPLQLTPTRVYTRWDLDRYLEEYAQWEPYHANVATYLHLLVVALTTSGKDQRAAAAAVDSVEPMALEAMSGAPAVVQCLDYPQRPSPRLELATATTVRLAAPITGWYRGIAMSMTCEGIDVAPDPVPVYNGNEWSTPLLLLGATLDAQTAYVWTVAMGTTFRASRTVTYVGVKHVTFGAAGSSCVDGYALDYLINLRLPATNVSCPNVDRPA